MSKYMIEYEGYLEPDVYDTAEEAIEAADEMASNSRQGLIDLINRGDDDDDDEDEEELGSYWIIEVDENLIEIDRFQP